MLRYGVEDETEQSTSEILNFGMLTKQMNNETKKETYPKILHKKVLTVGAVWSLINIFSEP